MADRINWFDAATIRKLERERLSRRHFLGGAAGLLATSSFLAACGGGGGGQDGEGKTIGLILNGFNVYDQCLASGVLQALEGTAYQFIGLQGNFDSAQEVANFEAMISRGVDGILVIPNTVQSASRGSLAAMNANIPVINVLWSSPTPADEAFVARIRVDNIRGGNLMAQWITENTEPGKILVVIGVPGQGFSETITQGLTEGLEVYGGGDWTIADTQPGFFTRTEAIKVAQNMLTAHPDAKIIVDYAAEMGNGIASFLSQRGMDDVISVTSDGNLDMVPWVRDGWIDSVRYYSSAEEGKLGAELMMDYLETGNAPDDVIDLEQAMVTAANLDEWLEKQPLCYEDHMDEVAKIG